MTHQDLRDLEKELWDAADNLRANSKLTAAEYKDPLLGLVLLRFAQNRYEDAKIYIEEHLPINPRTGEKRKAFKNSFYLTYLEHFLNRNHRDSFRFEKKINCN